MGFAEWEFAWPRAGREGTTRLSLIFSVSINRRVAHFARNRLGRNRLSATELTKSKPLVFLFPEAHAPQLFRQIIRLNRPRGRFRTVANGGKKTLKSRRIPAITG